LVAPCEILVAPRQTLGSALILVPPAFPHAAQSTTNATVHSPSCALVARYCELPSDDADGVEDAIQALAEALRAPIWAAVRHHRTRCDGRVRAACEETGSDRERRTFERCVEHSWRDSDDRVQRGVSPSSVVPRNPSAARTLPHLTDLSLLEWSPSFHLSVTGIFLHAQSASHRAFSPPTASSAAGDAPAAHTLAGEYRGRACMCHDG
jgi:hypothetical protein